MLNPTMKPCMSVVPPCRQAPCSPDAPSLLSSTCYSKGFALKLSSQASALQPFQAGTIYQAGQGTCTNVVDQTVAGSFIFVANECMLFNMANASNHECKALGNKPAVIGSPGPRPTSTQPPTQRS